MDWIFDPHSWVALVTLTVMEIVLGIDNIIFISILSGALPPEKQKIARTQGLAIALIFRLLLLMSLQWLMRLTEPLLTVMGHSLSGRDLILLAGGLFLLVKSTLEIHKHVEGGEEDHGSAKVRSLRSVIIQIALLDLVFSLDSVITAIGMVDRIAIMVTAVVIAIGVMMVFVGPVHGFVERHPTVKMLALSFLLLIGVALVGESLEMHIPKGYIYFAMAFSAFVEALNLRTRTKKPAHPAGKEA